MAVGWNGADPVEQVDGNDYELGTEYLANQDVTLTHVRVWSGAGEVTVTNRRGRVWSTGGSQLGIATMTDDLTPGWTTHALDAPVEVTAATKFLVSYSTGGNYGALIDGLALADVVSADGALTALSTANAAPNGNGVFNGTPGSFPTTSPGSHPFYGCDVAYDLGLGGNTAPAITQGTVTAAGALATATIVATDAETLVGATYRYDWGDGTSVTVSSSATATHAYTASGTYGVLLTVTDDGGLSDYAAAAVDVLVPSAALTPLDAAGIIDKVVSHALASGRFRTVNGHEPKSAPDTGSGQPAAAVWAQSIEPARGQSGLYLTSIRLVLNVRIYESMLAEPQDAIDPAIISAADALLAAYTGDFTLGGTVREVDLLGQTGVPLSAQAGYLNQDNKLFRVFTITLPLLCDNVWEQSP
jgi:PKD repeat protein